MHTRDLQNIHRKHILCKNHACISNCFCPKINLHLNSSFLWMFWSTLTIILQVKEGAKYGGTQKLVPQREVQGVQLAPPEGFVTSNLYRLAAGQGIYYPPCIGQGPCLEPASKLPSQGGDPIPTRPWVLRLPLASFPPAASSSNSSGKEWEEENKTFQGGEMGKYGWGMFLSILVSNLKSSFSLKHPLHHTWSQKHWSSKIRSSST